MRPMFVCQVLISDALQLWIHLELHFLTLFVRCCFDLLPG